MQKNEMETKQRVTTVQAAEMLQQIADCFKSGKLVLARDEHHVSLMPRGDVEMEVEVFQKKGKEKLSIKMEWQPVRDENETPTLKIMANDPPAAAIETVAMEEDAL